MKLLIMLKVSFEDFQKFVSLIFITEQICVKCNVPVILMYTYVVCLVWYQIVVRKYVHFNIWEHFMVYCNMMRWLVCWSAQQLKPNNPLSNQHLALGLNLVAAWI